MPTIQHLAKIYDSLKSIYKTKLCRFTQTLIVFNQALASKLLEQGRKPDRLLKEFVMLTKRMSAFLQAMELRKHLIFWSISLESKKSQIKLNRLSSKTYLILWVRFKLTIIWNNWISVSKIVGIHMIANFAKSFYQV